MYLHIDVVMIQPATYPNPQLSFNELIYSRVTVLLLTVCNFRMRAGRTHFLQTKHMV